MCMMDGLSRSRALLRGGAGGTLLAFVFGACSVLPPGLFAVTPTTPPAPTPSVVCSSADALQASVDTLGALELSEDELTAIGAQIDVVLGDARQVAEAVGDDLRPLVMDMIVALEGIRGTIDTVQEDGTLGSKIEAVGATLVEIGSATDALEIRFADRC